MPLRNGTVWPKDINEFMEELKEVLKSRKDSGAGELSRE